MSVDGRVMVGEEAISREETGGDWEYHFLYNKSQEKRGFMQAAGRGAGITEWSRRMRTDKTTKLDRFARDQRRE